MIRFASLLALATFSTAAAAGVGGEIAYSVGRDVFLVNPDGSGKRLIYRGATRASIFSISMKQDGGEMSFEEADAKGQSARLITISYGSTGSATVTRNVTGCRIGGMDTRADGALLVVNTCDGVVKFAPPGSSNFEPVGVPRAAAKVTWMADGSFLYASEAKIWQATMADPSGTAIATQNCVQILKSANAASEALVGVGSACIDGPRIYRLPVPTGSTSNVAAGPDAAYSQDDQCFIFVAPPGRKGAYLLMARLSGGQSVQFGNLAAYNSVDWRGDTAPTGCPLIANDALEFRVVK